MTYFKDIFRFEKTASDLLLEVQSFQQRLRMGTADCKIPLDALDLTLTSLRDLSLLDFWIDEFPRLAVLDDAGSGIASCFTSILLNTCGFRVFADKVANCSLTSYLLYHDEIDVILFPWQALMQSIVNYRGIQSTQRYWLDTLIQLSDKVLPSTWHPLIDIAYNDESYWPADVAELAEQIFSGNTSLLYLLSDTLCWSRQTPIPEVRTRLEGVLR